MEIIGTIICSIIAAGSAIAVAVIENRAQKERESAEERAERRQKENRLSMDLMYATCGLAMDTAKALRDGHTNGTVDGDLDSAKNARAAYENFIREEASIAVSRV